MNSSTDVAHAYAYNTIGNMTSKSVDGEFTFADQYHLDFQGSITHILSAFDVDQGEQNYSNLEEHNLFKLTRRGYTGHEHLTEHYLINMDGRMYDPYLGRMLSVDNYVQAPWSTVSYNRYAYVWNNPLKYTDPTGELLGTVFTFLWDLGDKVFTEGAIDPWNTKENRRAAWRDFDPTREGSKTNNAWRIDAGLFTGNFRQVISKFTWEIKQTLLGNLTSHGLNISGNVNGVEHFRGATVLDTDIEGGAFTVGSYIIGPEGFRPDFKDHLFVHEYGHYIQSQLLGPLYLSFVALPSVTDFWLVDKAFNQDLHDKRWYEAQASRFAVNYFDREFGSEKDDYFLNSPNHFDRNSFVMDKTISPYINPRNRAFNPGGHPTRSAFHWTDIPINWLLNGRILGY